MKIATIALTLGLLPLGAQEFQLPVNIDALAEKADEAVSVTMDKSMLTLASKFIKHDDDRDLHQILTGLDSIYVRSLEFHNDGEYSIADVDAVRKQLHGPAWGRLVGVRSKRGENVDVFFKDGGNGKLGGIVVIAAEPRELTIVHIVGTIDPEKIADLGGEFGIPRLERARVRREAE